jgi:aspartyl protease family protein
MQEKIITEKAQNDQNMQKTFIYIILITTAILLFTDCSHRRRRNTRNTSAQNRQTEQTSTQVGYQGKKSVVKMHKDNGVYYVPCKINGTEMKFIFDTGASDITMSATEAIFLIKQRKMSENDIVGTQQYQIADGSLQEGTIVILRTVEIGNRELKNVRASIVNNLAAPLLLGQSALSKFGEISINYNKNEITFE